MAAAITMAVDKANKRCMTDVALIGELDAHFCVSVNETH
jgi:hypothetical protein